MVFILWTFFFFANSWAALNLRLKGQIKVANIIIVFKHADNAMTTTEQMNSTLALQC